MESLGKEKDLDGQEVHQGLAVYGNKGSTDQHAYVQQLREGINNFFVTFIEVLTDYTSSSGNVSNLEVDPGVTSGDYLSGFFMGTRRALAEKDRQSLTITLDELSPYSLAALIALYERAVGLYATMININAYHQPGVEAGKKAAAQVIALQQALIEALRKQKGNALSVRELAQEAKADGDCETVYKILEHLAANPVRGVQRTGERHPLRAKYAIAV